MKTDSLIRSSLCYPDGLSGHRDDPDHISRSVVQDFGLQTQMDPEPDRNRFIRSDQYSFIRRGVPSLAFKFGYEKGSPEEAIQKEWTKQRYHAPSDDLTQPVNKDGAAQFVKLLATLAERVANDDARPQWKPDSFFRRFASGTPDGRGK